MRRPGAAFTSSEYALARRTRLAEIARLDPDGRGDVSVDLVPGRAVRLSERAADKSEALPYVGDGTLVVTNFHVPRSTLLMLVSAHCMAPCSFGATWLEMIP